MTSGQQIETSLLQLLKCNICLEEVNSLKVLSCQHTVCALCVKQLTVRNNRFKCAVCQKENPVPNGGFDQLPDSLLAKQIAEVIKEQQNPKPAGREQAGNVGVSGLVQSSSDSAHGKVLKDADVSKSATSSAVLADAEKSLDGSTDASKCGAKEKATQSMSAAAGAVETGAAETGAAETGAAETGAAETVAAETEKTEPLNLPKLKKDLYQALEEGRKWSVKADAMIKANSSLLETIPEKVENTTEAITAYQIKVTALCQEKLQALNKASEEQTAAIRSSLKEIQPKSDEIKRAIKSPPGLVKRLANKNVTPEIIAKAQRSLEELKKSQMAIRNHLGTEDFNTIKTGDSVKLKFLNEDECDIGKLVQGKVSHLSIGIYGGVPAESGAGLLTSQPEVRKAIVIFPEQSNWVGPETYLEKAPTKARLPFTGDMVRVKSSVTKPHFGWHGVRAKKSRGSIVQIRQNSEPNNLVVIVEFPENRQWMGLYTEIELIPGCGFEVGDQVWVKRSIPEPSRGWAGVNGSSIGKIKKISGGKGEEEVAVDFPECKDWVGQATELEFVRQPRIGERVQVKLSVTKPDFDWSRVTHDDVGILVNVIEHPTHGKMAEVNFPNRPNVWSCLLHELEPARYQPPNYDNSQEGMADGMIQINPQAFLANLFNQFNAQNRLGMF